MEAFAIIRSGPICGQTVKDALAENPFERLSLIVSRIIEGAILRAELKPGARLNVSQLSSSLGVSTSPVRDAMERLVSLGLVIAERKADGRYSSYYVFDISNSSISDLFEARRVIEGAAAAICARKPWLIRLDELGALAADFNTRLSNSIGHEQPYDNLIKTAELDRSFHTLLVESCGNEYLIRMYRDLRSMLFYMSVRTCNFVTTERDPDNVRLLGAQHMSIFRSIRDGYPDTARVLMDEHISLCCSGSLWNRSFNCESE